jgi:hypothetical protein
MTLPSTAMADWVALIGERRAGRDAVMTRLLDTLRGDGVTLGGCAQPALEAGGDVVGYDLVDLASGRTLPLARPSAAPQLCGYAFEADTFAWMRAELARRPPALTVLPCAKLEASGEGHWGALQDALHRPEGLVLVAMRPHSVARLALSLPDPADGLGVPCTAEEEAFTARLQARLRDLRRGGG